MCLGHYFIFLQARRRCLSVSSALLLNNNLWTLADLQKPALWNVAFWTQKLVCLSAAAHGMVLASVRQNKQWGGKIVQKAGKLRRNFSSISFLFLLCAAVGTRMGQLCGRCMQLLRDFVGFVQRVSSDLVQGIRECLILISKCFCLKQNSSKTRQLYKPIL